MKFIIESSKSNSYNNDKIASNELIFMSVSVFY